MIRIRTTIKAITSLVLVTPSDVAIQDVGMPISKTLISKMSTKTTLMFDKLSSSPCLENRVISTEKYFKSSSSFYIDHASISLWAYLFDSM